ncbi:electron transporter RnfC [Buchnera aphidicola (Diuraphis noxia)]|uniref:Ion-translocating oxidoreductase complex subunit C n=1 Tax=Buchnera aphidicola subsp. Diuraphis noxia TaxID=118101 RepID=A0A1B2H803_BUCDN|nr:electron transporter RnfC [Buchnera aphidicola (Diuraphis noxia)]
MIKGNFSDKQIRVKVNQKILRGQPLIFGNDNIVPVHSPTSGWIKDISFSSDFTENKKKILKIVVVPDYLDQWIRLKPIQNYKQYTSEKLIKKIYQSGVVGLGGAEFSSAKKLMLAMNKAHTLIVNAVESEPYITADYCLINNHFSDILIGCKIICWINSIKIVLIAIQEDKIESILKISHLIKNDSLFKICIIKKKYPGGSSKILVKALTGQEIPYNQHSIDIGYLVFNVATIYAIKQSVIDGKPLTERIITILSDRDFLSGNFWTRIGTPIKHFLSNQVDEKNLDLSVYLGGPFMGKKINNLNYSILKTNNFIFFRFNTIQYKNTINYHCIRCDYCSNVCPVNLLPQQIYLYAKNNIHEKTRKYNVLDCIECKACEKVCPSYIPLVKFFTEEKNILKNINIEKNFKKSSFLRFKKREERLLAQKKFINNKDKYLLNENKTKSMHVKHQYINIAEKNQRKEIVAAAIARIKQKQ